MTKIVRFSPRTDLDRMQREFDRMFGNFFPSISRSDYPDETASWAPRLDVIESEDAFRFEFDLPGLSKEDISINMHDGVLSVSGERMSRELDDNDEVVRVERFSGHFYRSFSIPSAINEKKIEASYENGVLSIRLPKAEESKPRKINIS